MLSKERRSCFKRPLVSPLGDCETYDVLFARAAGNGRPRRSPDLLRSQSERSRRWQAANRSTPSSRNPKYCRACPRAAAVCFPAASPRLESSLRCAGENDARAKTSFHGSTMERERRSGNATTAAAMVLDPASRSPKTKRCDSVTPAGHTLRASESRRIRAPSSSVRTVRPLGLSRAYRDCAPFRPPLPNAQNRQ